QTRLQLARDLIRDSRLAICEIAASVGYESRHAFSRSFKRATGVTATGYRLAGGNG
ncbi:MAG: helix-turn-helix domain-containing protein, partial [Luteimonas sp.]|nr:helix-turn-helix domain-containing protein [Luteimonas sp.]